MSLSAHIREQLLSTFRAELSEHLQTITDGLLALEQQQPSEAQRQEVVETIFRAAHSMKGAARAVGAAAIEQVAHALEEVLSAMRRQELDANPELFTAIFTSLDAISVVQAAYEAGETTSPLQPLEAIALLSRFKNQPKQARKPEPAVVAAPPEKAEPPAGEEKDASGEVRVTSAPGPVERQFETGPGFDPEGSLEKHSPAVNVSLEDALNLRFSESWLDDGLEALPPNGDEKPVESKARKKSMTKKPHQELETEVKPGTQANEGRLPNSKNAPAEPPSPPARRAIEHQQAQTPAANAAGILEKGHPTTDETIRVSVNKLEGLMAQLSELVVTKMRAEQHLIQLGDFQNVLSDWQKDWLETRSAYGRLARQQVNGNARTMDKDVLRILDYIQESQEHLRSLNGMMNDMAREYANDIMHMSLVIDKIEEDVKRVRMLPLHTITGSFARMVRDLAWDAGKQGVLQIVGADTELDKRVLEQIKDPLIHLLRNAVDHGLETPEEREAAGKPRAGQITLSAEQWGKDVIIRVSDDGPGMDIAGLRKVLVARRKADAVNMSDMELAQAAFETGISTKATATALSGRGIGLDVVRRNIESLNGRIDTSWKPGHGTTFTLTLPLRLTASRSLLVHTAGQTFAIPINSVDRILMVTPDQIAHLEGHDTILYNGAPTTLVQLDDVLELPCSGRPPAGKRIPVVILAAAERRLAFAVDKLESEQEVVIKPLGMQLQRVLGLAGATVMGNGEVVLILNAADLIKLALRGERRSVFDPSTVSESHTSSRTKRHILIVDDSITTRTLEKNILEAAGYFVQVATDGTEVMNAIAASGIPDLLISDVAMPRMDGFELTRRIKSDPNLAHLPVILVTSLESPEDKAMGIEVGADAYIVKGSFDQNNLLETIQQLI